MPRPKKIKSPEDFGKEFEKLKKPRKQEVNTFHGEPITKEQFDKIYNEVTDKNVGKSPLEELQELEKKLRDCTTENPTVITYGFTGDKTSLYIEFFDHIKIIADAYCTVKSFCIESKKPYLATAHKMHEVLKEWRGEQ